LEIDLLTALDGNTMTADETCKKLGPEATNSFLERAWRRGVVHRLDDSRIAPANFHVRLQLLQRLLFFPPIGQIFGSLENLTPQPLFGDADDRPVQRLRPLCSPLPIWSHFPAKNEKRNAAGHTFHPSNHMPGLRSMRYRLPTGSHSHGKKQRI